MCNFTPGISCAFQTHFNEDLHLADSVSHSMRPRLNSCFSLNLLLLQISLSQSMVWSSTHLLKSWCDVSPPPTAHQSPSPSESPQRVILYLFTFLHLYSHHFIVHHSSPVLCGSLFSLYPFAHLCTPSTLRMLKFEPQITSASGLKYSMLLNSNSLTWVLY